MSVQTRAGFFRYLRVNLSLNQARKFFYPRPTQRLKGGRYRNLAVQVLVLVIFTITVSVVV